MLAEPTARWRVLLARHRRVVVYLGVGAVSFLVDVGGLVVLHELAGAPVWVAATTGYWASVAMNYVLNRTLAFRDRTTAVASAVRYLVLLGVNWLATLAVIALAGRVGLDYLVGKVAAVLLLTALNYVAYSQWVFADRSPGTAGDDVHDVAGPRVVEQRRRDVGPGHPDDRER